jgi:hypothetical protein
MASPDYSDGRFAVDLGTCGPYIDLSTLYLTGSPTTQGSQKHRPCSEMRQPPAIPIEGRSTRNTERSSDENAALDVCLRLLSSLRLVSSDRDRGRKQFISTLAPFGTAIHSRRGLSPSNGLQHEDFPTGFADRIPWSSGLKLSEPLLDEATVLVDHDLAMVWTPYYFVQEGEVTHVGTNCFTLIKADWESIGQPNERGEVLEWRITGMSDTARKPSSEDLDKISKARKP